MFEMSHSQQNSVRGNFEVSFTDEQETSYQLYGESGTPVMATFTVTRTAPLSASSS